MRLSVAGWPAAAAAVAAAASRAVVHRRYHAIDQPSVIAFVAAMRLSGPLARCVHGGT